MDERYRKAIFAVVYARVKNGIMYLLLKRKHHWRGWEFTKGGINEKESKIAAAGREVFEETGQKPINILDFNVSGKYTYKKKLLDREGIIGQTYSLFGAEIKFGEAIKIDPKEHSWHQWLTYNEAVKKLTFKNQKKCLNIVNKWLMENEKRKV